MDDCCVVAMAFTKRLPQVVKHLFDCGENCLRENKLTLPAPSLSLIAVCLHEAIL
jgi:hypothetical protein